MMGTMELHIVLITYLSFLQTSVGFLSVDLNGEINLKSIAEINILLLCYYQSMSL